MIVGIDLGTTNSLIGTYGDQGPRLFTNALGDVLTPSVVSLDDAGGLLIGRAAKDRLATHPDSSVGIFKRWMGTSRETRLGNRSFRPEELSALVLKSLVADVEAATGVVVKEAVISVPAYFSDAQRKATKAAGQLAGITVERLINEPTAAALAYGLQERRDGGRFLVFDLGGGTFDVTIVELFEGVVEVHASAGDTFLGGEDFLDLLETSALTDLGITAGSLSAQERGMLRQRLERLKRDLSTMPSVTADLLLGGVSRSWACNEARFSTLVEPLIERLRSPIERALRDANLSPDKLDEVILVGGATRMPLVPRLVSRLFSRLPLRHVNPDQAIALGAAIAGGLKARNAKLEEVILTDVCPYSLGTQVVRRDAQGNAHQGYFLPIIERNSAVPVSKEHEIWPAYDNQDKLLVDIYQGEHPRVEKNIKLGEVMVALPTIGDRQERGTLVRFTYDINGLLQVNVKVKATGQMHELILEQNPGVLSPAEIKDRLAALAPLKVHPRDIQENLAAIARAERLYEEYLAARDVLQDMIMQFRSTLESQDVKRISIERKQFEASMDRLER